MTDPKEEMARAAAAVVPRVIGAILGSLLLLGVAVLLLTEGAGLVRSVTDTLPQPWRSVIFTAVLVGATLALGLFGRRLMEYTIFTKPRLGDEE